MIPPGSHWVRRALLLGWIVLAAWTALAALGPRQTFTAQKWLQYTDTDLYADVVAAVGRGESYYAAANRLQRQHNYPVRPFYTTRLPTLALFIERVGAPAARLALMGLLLATVLAWRRSLADSPLVVRIVAPILVLPGGIAIVGSNFIYLHEIWAGLLMALAVALRDRWPASLAIAGLALAVRELALPFVLLALAFAVWGRRRREAVAWAVLIAIFAAAMVLHAQAALAHPSGQASPGWVTLRGPLAAFHSLSEMPPFRYVGPVLTPILALVCLLGWARAAGERGLFGLALMTGYLAGLSVFGRSDNGYWTLLLLPTLVIGLAFFLVRRQAPQPYPAAGQGEFDSAPPALR